MTAFYNRVKWTATSSGTGSFVVSAAVTGYRTPAGASVPNGAVVHYVATNASETEWEIGVGTYTSGSTTLARTTVLENSNGDTSAVNFSTAPVVWFDWLAQDVAINDIYDYGTTNVHRIDADTIALRNSTTTQELQIYGSYTDSTNWNRIRIIGQGDDSWGSGQQQFATAFIGEKDGTGVARDFAFYQFGADGTNTEGRQRVATIGRYSSFSTNPNNVPWSIHSNIWATLQLENKGTGASALEPERTLHLAAAGGGTWLTCTSTGHTTLPSNHGEVSANQDILFWDMYASTLINSGGGNTTHWGGACLIYVSMDGYSTGVANQYPSKLQIYTNRGIGGYEERLAIPASGITRITFDSGTSNSVHEALRITHRGSFNAGATGIGVELGFAAHNTASTLKKIAGISAVTTDATSTSEDADLIFKTMAAGATAAEVARMRSDGGISIGSGNDVLLWRDAAAQLALRNSTTSQALRVYNTYTSSTSYERLSMAFDTNKGRIQTEKGSGGGTARDLELSASSGVVKVIGTTASNDSFQVDGSAVGTSGYANFHVIGDTRTYQIGLGNSAETSFGVATKFFIYDRTGGKMQFVVDGANAHVGLRSTAALGWSSTDGTQPATWGLDTFLYRDTSNAIAQRNSTTSQTFRVYNTFTSSTNYERLSIAFDTNKGRIQTENGAGGGTARDLELSAATGTVRIVGTSASNDSFKVDGSGVGSTGYANFHVVGSGRTYQIGLGNASETGFGVANNFFIYDRDGGKMKFVLDGANSTIRVPSDMVVGWFNSSGLSGATTTMDLSFSRVAAKVVALGDGAANANGWLQWGGQKRVTADFSKTSDTTLADVTGLSVSVAAGRTYSFRAMLPYTCAAAGGVKAAIAGTATATDIRYNGWIVDSAANGITGNTQASALATTVASATTTGTDGIIEIAGTITVNAAGTLTVQFAQNTSNGTASVVKRGAYFLVHDIA